MKKSTLAAVAIGAALCAAGLSTTASAQTYANGPYYATPSWDQTFAPNTRFIVLSNFNNEGVLDRETGLVWQRTWSGTFLRDLNIAQASCVIRKLGGRAGWRLPTAPEFASLLEPTATSFPPLPAGHPFFVPAGGSFETWTATIPSGRGGEGSAVNMASAPSFGAGLGSTQANADVNKTFICVRGPGGPT